MTVLDERQYPWTQPEGRELYRMLISLYPTARAAGYIARQAGVDLSMIDQEQAAAYVWTEILEYCAPRRGKLRLLVERVQEQSPNDFLAALLAGDPPLWSAEPVSDGGAPTFVHDRDDVTEPEALLFRDDLSLPIGRVTSLIDTLQHLVALAPAVCKLTVRAGATEQYGTAFRVGPDVLLTNWHVVHGKIDQAPASLITAEFGFEDDSTGRPVAGTTIACDTAIVAMDQDDDWAVVRTVDALQPHWPVIDLDRAVKPNRNDSAFIIQHPLGHRKRVGFVRNQVSYVDDRIVQYLTDTDVGSSGAPVFNAEGRLIALHHAGGRPQEVAGKPPIRKNEGILISRISNGWQQPKP